MNTYEVHCQRCGERIATFKMTDMFQMVTAKIRQHERLPHTPA